MGAEELISGETQDLSLPSGQQEKIKVLVRLRPLNDKEIAFNDVSDWECINKDTIIFKNTLPERSMFPTAYAFDRVFGYDSPTKEVYEEGAKEVSLSVVSGINSSIFAYGQTSSGKTYTMRGITDYAVSDIYDYIEKHKEREFVLKFSAMEIYNEAVRDLLISDTSPLRLLDDPERGTVVERLTEETLRDKSHLQELLAICEAQRQIGETSLNETSSRSHQILRLTIESSAREYIGSDKSSTLTATVSFVDLAGSERASQAQSAGVRLKEGSHINRSLLTLGKVVRALSKGRNAHIPYRDSKLTRILQNSLGGNARTAIICTMSPARSQLEQSRNTLLFASCAKEISTSARVNVVMSDKALVKQLQKELARLESEMKKLGSTSGTYDSNSLLKEKELIIEQMEKDIQELTRQRDLAELRIENLLQSSINEKIEGKGFSLGPGGKEGRLSETEATDEDALSSVSLQGGTEQEGKGEVAVSSAHKKDKDSSPTSKDPTCDALKQKIQELQRTIHYLVNLYPQEQTPSSVADMDSSRSAKINRSASCRAIIMSNPFSLEFGKAEHSENTRPNWTEVNFAGRTGGFYRRLSEIKYAAKSGNFSRKDYQISISGASVDSFKESDADDTTSCYEHSENTPSFNSASILSPSLRESEIEDSSIFSLVPGHSDLVHKAVMNNIKDAGLNQVSSWSVEFESRRKEIIELWDACKVPLVHRTCFYLLFKGDPSDSVYMEVELRRLSFLKSGSVSKESLNASLKALYREREALSKQIHQKFLRKERQELYQKWGIALNTKQRSLQLARRIWTDTKDMNHIQESAALVAKLVGFLNSGLAPKEVFGLSFLAAPGSMNTRSFSWRHTKSSASLLGRSPSLLL